MSDVESPPTGAAAGAVSQFGAQTSTPGPNRLKWSLSILDILVLFTIMNTKDETLSTRPLKLPPQLSPQLPKDVAGTAPAGEKTCSGTTRVKSTTPPLMFLGCGWSYEDALDTCRDKGRDDTPFVVEETVVVTEARGVQIEETAGTPCSVGGNSALLNSAIGNGRWIRISPEVLQQCSALSFFMDRFSHTNHGAREPEECWIRDNFAKFAAGSANGNQRMPPEAIWRSELQLGTFEYVWKPYSCTIPLYTDEMIRTCFAEKGYARPVVKGDSISDFFRTYVEQRVKGARLTQFGSRAFEIQNFKLAHIVWHEDTVEAAVPVFKANGLEKGTGGARFWMLGPFFSSEREHHIMPGRYEYMASSMRETIEGAGYMEVDWREISKALAFDSATYLDGLHVVGPPMKTLFNIFIHAACSGDL